MENWFGSRILTWVAGGCVTSNGPQSRPLPLNQEVRMQVFRTHENQNGTLVITSLHNLMVIFISQIQTSTWPSRAVFTSVGDGKNTRQRLTVEYQHRQFLALFDYFVWPTDMKTSLHSRPVVQHCETDENSGAPYLHVGFHGLYQSRQGPDGNSRYVTNSGEIPFKIYFSGFELGALAFSSWGMASLIRKVDSPLVHFPQADPLLPPPR